MRSKSCPEKGLVRRETRGGKCIHAELVRKGPFPGANPTIHRILRDTLERNFRDRTGDGFRAANLVRKCRVSGANAGTDKACFRTTLEKLGGSPRGPCLERVAFEFETFMMTKRRHGLTRHACPPSLARSDTEASTSVHVWNHQLRLGG